MAKAKKKDALALEEKLERALVPVDEQPYEVPENWCWLYLGALLTEIKNGTTIKQDKSEEGYSVTRIESLQNQTIDFNRLGTIVDSNTIKETDWYQAGDIAMSHINSAEHVGKTAMITEDMLPLVHGMNLLRLRFNKCCLPRYFQYFTQSYQYKDEILKRINMAVNQVSINQKQVGTLEFPLPPLAEQQRIVEQIENLFAKLDEAKDKLQEALDSYQRRKMSLLYKAYNGELTGGWRTANGIDLNSWSTVTINDISDVKGGKRVPKGMELVTENTGQPYIKAGNLKQGTVIDDGIMYVPDEVYKYIKNYTVKTGDVYITNVGACIGDCGVIPEKYDGANLTENAVKMTNLKCESDFLALYLETSAVQQMIKGLIASATLGKLSIANIKTIEINLPSMDEQKEIVKIVKEILAKEDITKEQIVKVVQQVDLMKKSILAKAFRGELGTNNPAEESAVELLKSMLEQEG